MYECFHSLTDTDLLDRLPWLAMWVAGIEPAYPRRPIDIRHCLSRRHPHNDRYSNLSI